MSQLLMKQMRMVRRHLPLVLTLLAVMVVMSTGLHAQTPIETVAQRMTDVFIRISPYLATLAFGLAGILVAVGHHDAYPRLVSIAIGSGIALGAISMVNYFRP
jgi:type IV secretory pathway VirB2 component (pilin)